MAEEKKFIDGLFVNDKSKAPEFVNAKLAITPKFIEFYNNNCNAKGNLKFDIKTSKNGRQYAELDTWQPEEKFVRNEEGQIEVEEVEEEINVNQIPF